MSGRLLWFAAGAGSVVWLGVKGRRAAYRLTPEGLADQAGAARLGLRALAAEYAAGAAAKEQVLAHRLGPDREARRELGAVRASEAAGTRPRLVAAPDTDTP